MGPSGPGKSTLLHCVAGLDSLTSGKAFIGDTDLSTLDDTELTVLRRAVGFVFQAFNLVPDADAEENITLPLALAGRKGDRDWIDQVVDAGPGPRGRTARASSPAASSSAWPSPGRWPAGRRSSSPTSRPATSTPGPAPRCWGFLRQAVDDLGQTIVMVTHDPVAASYADRVVFLADGRIVDEMSNPTAERVLDRMKRLRRLTEAHAEDRAPQPAGAQAAPGHHRPGGRARRRVHRRDARPHRHHAARPSTTSSPTRTRTPTPSSGPRPRSSPRLRRPARGRSTHRWSTRSPPSTAWPSPRVTCGASPRSSTRTARPVGDPGMGPPTFGVNWTVDDELNPWTLVEGRAATRPTTRSSSTRARADDAGYAVGDRPPSSSRGRRST